MNTLKNIIKHKRYAIPFLTLCAITAVWIGYNLQSFAMYIMNVGNINLAELIISSSFLCAYLIGAIMIIHEQNR